MGKGGHYVKPHEKKPYLKKWEWILLISILSAAALCVAAYFIVQMVSDDSLPVKDGMVITDVENPIIVNEGTSDKPKYYLYGSYDFAPLDTEVTVADVNGDVNETSVYLYPHDEAYSYAFLYGEDADYAETAQNVQSNIGKMLQHGDVHQLTTMTRNGQTGSAYWYTFWNEETDENGQTVLDEDGNAVLQYQQTFSCYMPTSRGCLILRVTHKGADENAYVDEAVGYEEIGAILDCIRLD